MKHLDRYLASTVATTMALSSLGLVALFVIFTFLDQVEDVKNDYTLLTAAQYVSYSIPRMFYETLPYAALIGCLTGLGLLASNSELIVMRSSGVSTWQITWATLKPALALVVAGLLVGELLLPDFERTARLLRENATELDITPQGGFWYRENQQYMHFNAISPAGELQNINKYAAEKEALSRTLWAERAHYREDQGNWLLENVIITDLQAGNEQRRLVEMVWETTLTPELLKTEILVEPDKMSILELRRKINHMRSEGLNTGKFELGFWTKTFQPIASLSLVFVAISFIFGPLRESTMGMRVVSGLVIGILFKFVQDLLSPASLVFGFPPILATLVPILLCLAAGVLLLRRAN
ncbi:MAG: LPS export ABC transporter permease LptG [Pseudomonadales bacterium]|nr:LPS export ABC transporter permease LptG [Pseudomonadales bacterium]MBO6595176.1 LPS export ABC transporter permease LptG [Pseudomonadales bacterium]MBO6656209.1 LPS export ABC transporter permease LptG [Pseudomonadales bacterium]MBO6701682.1 LPS export ABC transporter permease LptG [Pseudomonadales bacterium]MBO6821265.1 LPS export ABC transporter permease LptG [Pseudomonadales bacterium]